ncbi:MAG: transposase, partial [Myxococcaceae bacterium]
SALYSGVKLRLFRRPMVHHFPHIGGVHETGAGSMTIEGPTTADVFEAFVDHMLIPELKEGDVVVLDNVGAHKPERIAEKIRAAGAHVLFLPPYSPDLNPIEPCWGKLKGTLKSISATTRRALDDAIAHGMSLITPQDAAAWFHHCGYGGQPT